MVSHLLAQQKDCTNFPYFLCSRIFKIVKITRRERNGPNVTPLKHEMPNVIYDPIVSRDKIIFSSFHIKLGLMKQFVKALRLNAEYF